MSSIFREVTKDEFFAALSADKRDIMPRIVSPWCDLKGYTSEWRVNGGEGLFGRTTGNSTVTYELFEKAEATDGK